MINKYQPLQWQRRKEAESRLPPFPRRLVFVDLVDLESSNALGGMGMADEVNLMLSAREEDDDGDASGLGAGEAFDPSEDELVLHFLRPQLRGFPPRVSGAVVEADPCSAAPWDLLGRYGMRERGHFFAARGRSKPSVRRAVGGGLWMRKGTKSGVSVSALGLVVRWSRARFCFYVKQRNTAWVLEEYEITDPRCYRRDDEGVEDAYWVLCRVRKSSSSNNAVTPPFSPPGTSTLRKRMLAAGSPVGVEAERFLLF